MTVQNLSIVFGPTLFGQMTPDQMVNGGMADTQFQNRVSADSHRRALNFLTL